jgi:hypothetical protein
MGRIGLKTIVAELIDSKDSSSHEFRRMYNIGVRGVREFNTDIVGNFSTKLLDVNANKTADLPEDYVSYSKMGVINEKGEIVTLRSNPQLSNYNIGHPLNPDRFEGVPGIGAVSYPAIPYNYPYIYYNFFISNQSFNLFGLAGGGQDIGNYKVDEECGIIIFGPNFKYEKVLLEYLGDGMDRDCDDYMIDSRAAEAMLAYIRWKTALDNPKKYGQGIMRDYKQEYKSERLKAKMRINKIVVSEFEDIQRITNKLAPRS